MPSSDFVRRIGSALLFAVLLFTAAGFGSEVARVRGASKAASRRGAPPRDWRFESPEVRRLRGLVTAAAERVGDRGPVVFEARPVEPDQERFVYLWAQFLGPELELVLRHDRNRQELRPSHWLTYGPRAEAPRGARRRVPLPGGVLFVLR